MKALLFLGLAAFLAWGIPTTTPDSIDKEALYGTWLFGGYQSGSRTLIKEQPLRDQPATTFLESGKLIKRQNVSWCGTPPVTYDDFKGNWTWTSDTTITMRYEYWGGEMEVDWLIKYLDQEQLQVVSLDQRKVEKD